MLTMQSCDHAIMRNAAPPWEHEDVLQACNQQARLGTTRHHSSAPGSAVRASHAVPANALALDKISLYGRPNKEGLIWKA